MQAWHIAPKPSRVHLTCIVVLHAFAAWVFYAALTGIVWWGVACFWVVSLGLALWQWRLGAAYFLDVQADGQVFLQTKKLPRQAVVLASGHFVSRQVLVAVWQDKQGVLHRTVLFADSVSRREFKWMYVWLRWRGPLKKVKKT